MWTTVTRMAISGSTSETGGSWTMYQCWFLNCVPPTFFNVSNNKQALRQEQILLIYGFIFMLISDAGYKNTLNINFA